MIDEQILLFRSAVHDLQVMLHYCPYPDIVQEIKWSGATYMVPPEYGDFSRLTRNAPVDPQSIAIVRLCWNDLCRLEDPYRDYPWIINITEKIAQGHDNAWSHCFSARALCGVRRYGDALLELRKALDKEPDNVSALDLYCQILVITTDK